MPIMHFYLGEGARAAVLDNQKRMVTRVKAAVEAAGWKVKICPEEERIKIERRPGHHLVVNQEVPAPNCLTLRRVGWEPFWRIERTNDRWDWQITTADYDPAAQDPRRAAQFLGYWGGRLFGAAPLGTGGGVFVPLQGKLTQQRHFQAASPIEMLQAVAQRWPDRAVTATLLPGETYGAADRAALSQLEAACPNLSVRAMGSDAALRSCDLVVTMNSTMALKALVAQKPVMLWARIDFHHIAASVPRDGRDAAFAQVEAGLSPDFGRYLLWYFRKNCLRSWDEGVEAEIRARLQALGWPMQKGAPVSRRP